jgi:hypothetical protein
MFGEGGQDEPKCEVPMDSAAMTGQRSRPTLREGAAKTKEMEARSPGAPKANCRFARNPICLIVFRASAAIRWIHDGQGVPPRSLTIGAANLPAT